MSKWGAPERDIWSLGPMYQGSCQIGRVLGTSPPPSPSPGSSGWHSGRGTMFGVLKLEFDTYTVWEISEFWDRSSTQKFEPDLCSIVIWPGEPFWNKCICSLDFQKWDVVYFWKVQEFMFCCFDKNMFKWKHLQFHPCKNPILEKTNPNFN